MRILVAMVPLVFAVVISGCGDGSPKGDGEECFSSSECATGLLCDFGSTPSVCRPMQTSVDGSVTPAPDASRPPVDAQQPPVDAPPVIIDAAVDAPPPDAAVDAAVDAAAGALR